MKKIILLIICMLSFNVVNALSLEMICPSTVDSDSQFNLVVYLNKDDSMDSISAIEGMLSYDKNELLLLGYDYLLPGWNSLSLNDRFAFGNLNFNNLINNSRTEILIIKFISLISSGNINVSINDAIVTDSNGDEVSLNGSANCSFNVLSNVNTLSSISVSNGELSPLFDSNINLYNLSVDTETITINYTKSDSKSIVNCDCDNVKLDYGNNIVKLLVTSESGLSRVYTLNINRIDSRTILPSNDNSLKSLKITNAKINFSKENTFYDIKVSGDVDSVTITSVLNSDMAHYLEWSSEKSVDLDYGLNEFNIKIVAENGDIKIYTLNITRVDERDTDNDLSDIIISSGKINFNSSILEYIVNVDSEVDNITINPKSVSQKALVNVKGPKKLDYGNNDYQIEVTAENGNVKVYKLLVIRNVKGTKLSNVALLESLTIYGYDIEFDSNKFKYSIVSDETSFKISAIPLENGSYYVLNNGKIDSSNKLVIRVTAEDGSTNDYIIKVNAVVKEEEKELILTKIIPILIIFILFVVGLVCYICVGKKTREKKEGKN